MKIIDNSLKSFQVPTSLPQWVIWAGALGLFFISWIIVGVWARQTALNDMKHHTDRWEADGILYQETSYTCVPVSIVMLLDDQGIETTTYEVALIAGTDIFGTSNSGIIRAGRRYGYDVKFRRMGFDEFMKINKAAILQFRHEGIKHAAYISKLTEEYMVVKDPSQGLLVFGEDGAYEYFGPEPWEIAIFEKKTD